MVPSIINHPNEGTTIYGNPHTLYSILAKFILDSLLAIIVEDFTRHDHQIANKMRLRAASNVESHSPNIR